MTPAEAEAIRRKTIASQQPTAAELTARERDVQYRQEQAEIQKQRRMPTVQEQVVTRAVSPLIAIRERNIQRMNAPRQPSATVTREEVQRMLARKKGAKQKQAMGRGQFHEPRTTMKNIDPFASMTGAGRKRKRRNPFW